MFHMRQGVLYEAIVSDLLKNRASCCDGHHENAVMRITILLILRFRVVG
jgi:hypothetical protein